MKGFAGNGWLRIVLFMAFGAGKICRRNDRRREKCTHFLGAECIYSERTEQEDTNNQKFQPVFWGAYRLDMSQQGFHY
jgi:hypothetical protein